MGVGEVGKRENLQLAKRGNWQFAIGKDFGSDMDISFKVYLIELLEGGKRTLSGAEVVVGGWQLGKFAAFDTLR